MQKANLTANWRLLKVKGKSFPIVVRKSITLICAGPTGSGKTILIAKILEHYKIMFDPIPDKIIYCYSIWQESFLQMLESNPNIKFVEGMIPSVQKKKIVFFFLTFNY